MSVNKLFLLNNLQRARGIVSTLKPPCHHYTDLACTGYAGIQDLERPRARILLGRVRNYNPGIPKKKATPSLNPAL